VGGKGGCEGVPSVAVSIGRSSFVGWRTPHTRCGDCLFRGTSCWNVLGSLDAVVASGLGATFPLLLHRDWVPPSPFPPSFSPSCHLPLPAPLSPLCSSHFGVPSSSCRTANLARVCNHALCMRVCRCLHTCVALLWAHILCLPVALVLPPLLLPPLPPPLPYPLSPILFSLPLTMSLFLLPPSILSRLPLHHL